MQLTNNRTIEFIRKHRSDNVVTLALAAGKYPDVDMPLALDQIQGWQTARHKLPSWAATDGIVYPPHINMEQCSSEFTARYKADVASQCTGGRLLDLTGGFGVDFSFMSQKFGRATYVELNAGLCSIASHNFEVLGLKNVEAVNADGTEYLRTCGPADLIYIDPSRRDGNGNRVYNIADCTPDVVTLAPLMLEKAGVVMIKLSPMFDWHEAVRELPCVADIHIVSTGNDCKELLVILKRGKEGTGVAVHCVNDSQEFDFTYDDEALSALPEYIAKSGDATGCHYLFEPNASIMKAGCFNEAAAAFHISPISANTHIFVSAADHPDFPGRRFAIISVSSMNKKELRRNLAGIRQANITARNFPMSVQALRKRLKISDGGDLYIFATTTEDGRHVLIITKKMH